MSQLREKLAGNAFVQRFAALVCSSVSNARSRLRILLTEAQERGLIVISAGPNVIRLLPNLLVTNEEIDHGCYDISRIIGSEAYRRLTT